MLSLKGQIQTTRKFSPNPLSTTQQGSHHPPNYAPLRESRHQVFINRCLLELKLRHIDQVLSECLFQNGLFRFCPTLSALQII